MANLSNLIRQTVGAADTPKVGTISEDRGAGRYIVDIGGGKNVLALGAAGAYRVEQSVFVDKSPYGWVITGVTPFEATGTMYISEIDK